MSILINTVLLTVAVIFVKYAYSQDDCPESPVVSSLCSFDHDYFGIHERNCEHDIYMSICALSHVDNKTIDSMWTFMCTSVNYCLGCRYAYTHCYTGYDESISHNCGDEQLVTMLAWYDAFTMGGKFALCDMGNDTVLNTVRDCLDRNQDVIDTCNINLQNTIYRGFNNRSATPDCSEMNTRIECFIDIVHADCSQDVVNVFTSYFQGVVSMSPCEGHIPSVPGGTSGLLSSGLIMLVSLTLIAIANCV